MIIWLQNLPIKRKLIAMMMIPSSVAMLLMALALAVNVATTERDTLQKELATLAKVIGSRSTGALTFNDSRTAYENLSALQTNSNIVYAAIFQQNGSLFTEFQPVLLSRDSQQTERFKLSDALRQFVTTKLSGTTQITTNIFLEGERIGKILIISSLDTFYTNLVNYLGACPRTKSQLVANS